MTKKTSAISRRLFLKKTALLTLPLILDACGGGASGLRPSSSSSTSNSDSSSSGSSGPIGTSTSGSSGTGSSYNALYDGVIQVGTGANSNRFVNGEGTVIQLRGCNMSGLENTVAQGWTTDPWGDGGGTPDWETYATWKPNIVRLPLNAASWLGLTCDFTTGPEGSPVWANTPRNANNGANYRQTVIDAVASAQAIGCYVIIDLHWCLPKITLGGVTKYPMPLGQSAFADVDTAIPFWQSIANTFGTQATPPTSTNGAISNKGIMFELFNEPYMNNNGGTMTTAQGGGATLTADQILGSGGWSSYIINNTQGGTNYHITSNWQVAGHQQMLNTIRATGAKNVCIINGNYYTQDLTAYQTYMPTDSLNQFAFGWHPYPAYSTNQYQNYPYTTAPYKYPACGAWSGAGTTAAVTPAENIIAAGYPVICTEDGGFGGTLATSGEPHMSYMQNWADSVGASYLSWMWGGTQAYGTTNTENYLTVFAADKKTILPIQGEGQVTYDWMVNHT